MWFALNLTPKHVLLSEILVSISCIRMHDNRGTHPLFSSERASFVFAVCLLVIVGCQGLSSTITKHMFDPTQQQAKKTEKKIKKAAIKKLKQWSLEVSKRLQTVTRL